MQKQLLVIGAQPGSLGEAVVQAAEDDGFIVIIAGLPELDVTNAAHVRKFFQDHYCPNVVCTVGVNYDDRNGSFSKMLDQHMQVNCIGVLNCVHQWAKWVQVTTEMSIPGPVYECNFIAVSSNSAHVARSQSVAYCASKAALSMGIRGMARKLANTDLNIWCYEPGWIDGTPMSERVTRRLVLSDIPGHGHRIPGVDRTWEPQQLATRIVQDLYFGRQLNGCCIRLDAGEQ